LPCENLVQEPGQAAGGQPHARFGQRAHGFEVRVVEIVT